MVCFPPGHTFLSHYVVFGPGGADSGTLSDHVSSQRATLAAPETETEGETWEKLGNLVTQTTSPATDPQEEHPALWGLPQSLWLQITWPGFSYHTKAPG